MRDRIEEQAGDHDEEYDDPEAEDDEDFEDEDYDEPEAEEGDDSEDDEEAEPEERPKRARRARSAH